MHLNRPVIIEKKKAIFNILYGELSLAHELPLKNENRPWAFSVRELDLIDSSDDDTVQKLSYLIKILSHPLFWSKVIFWFSATTFLVRSLSISIPVFALILNK